MKTEVNVFKPAIAELSKIADEFRGLNIKDIHDTATIAKAKEGKKELAQLRITITKIGKAARDEAIAYQREVIRQEKEHLEIIAPVEAFLKEQLDRVDDLRAIEERKVLLPDRRKEVEELGLKMTDEEILLLDSEDFERVVTAEKSRQFEEAKRLEREKEAEKARKREIAEAKKTAAAEATRKAEEKAKREKDAEAKAEADRIAQETAEREKAEKNKRYKTWVDTLGINTSEGDKIERVGDTFIAFKKVGEITIK